MNKPVEVKEPTSTYSIKDLEVDFENDVVDVGELDNKFQELVKHYTKQGGVVTGEYKLETIVAVSQYDTETSSLQFIYKGGLITMPNRYYEREKKEYDRYLVKLTKWKAEQAAKKPEIDQVRQQIQQLQARLIKLVCE